MTRDASGHITRVRHVLPRHKAATWVGPVASHFLDRYRDLLTG